MSYVTQEYDFYNAIMKGLGLGEVATEDDLLIDKVLTVGDNRAIVYTSHGTFCCETFEDAEANIFMRVDNYLA